jgi:two-component system response regulator CpxR
MNMDRILVLIENPDLSDRVAESLTAKGFAVETLSSSEPELDRIMSGGHNLAILDLMLNEMGGFEMLRLIRAKSRIPVLLITNDRDEVDGIIGLELGADDYLPQPINHRELSARVRAILRRVRPEHFSPLPPAPIIVGEIELDEAARVARRMGERLDLTSMEFDLLHVFLQSPGRVIPREDLARLVLGRPFNPLDRSIDMHVSNLRKKLGHGLFGGECIKAIRGVGYIFRILGAGREMMGIDADARC